MQLIVEVDQSAKEEGRGRCRRGDGGGVGERKEEEGLEV